MAGGELRLFRQWDQLVFRPQGIVRQIATGHAGIGEQRGDATLDINPAVAARRAGLIGNLIQRLFVRQQVFRHRFQHLCALLERHVRQRRAAVAARIAQARRQRQAVGADLVQRLTGHGVADPRPSPCPYTQAPER